MNGRKRVFLVGAGHVHLYTLKRALAHFFKRPANARSPFYYLISGTTSISSLCNESCRPRLQASEGITSGIPFVR